MMTTSEYSPLLRNSSSRSTTQHHQHIEAHYFNITDVQSWPIAGLLVLLDNRRLPVRAELHLYDTLPAHVQEAAVRQARMVLQDQYIGGDPVSLRIMETAQMREAMQVRLPPLGARAASQRAQPWRLYALVGATVLAAGLLIWFIAAMLRPDSTANGSDPVAATATTITDGAEAAVENVDAGDAEADTSEAAPAAGTDGTGGSALPISRNARPDLGIGMQVRIVPGLQLALRSEPGADAGLEVGVMADGEEATIIGGPRMTQGDADTIVWWFVELDDGTQAWAAANTSELTLLIPTGSP